MFHKALWYQNFKQTRMIVGILLVLFILYLPFFIMLSIGSWQEQVEHFSQFPDSEFTLYEYEVYNIFSVGIFPFLVVIGIIFFAGLLIGVERNTRRMDFTFSLPFSRREIFMAKWLYGILVIFVFHLINFSIAYVILWQSEFNYALSFVNLTEIYFAPIFVFLLFFSFAMFIGTIAGEMITQVALTFIFSIFPVGVFFLLHGFLELHLNTHFLYIPEWVGKVTLFFYLFEITSQPINLFFPISGIILFTVLSLILYERNNIEHNGEFLIFKVLHPIFLIGITICFSLLGGIIVSSLAPWNAEMLRIISYWFGFTVFLVFSYLISRRLLRMNLTIKNK
ncbi:ABC transporter permease subunit [Evansella tamaricis]|uniref:ABC transporter permease n=1 Tax=Evansella tamaricis TaxID=2069301 RepID=A0ABS6JM82_9BACI|nr:ABC transporter permease subunit [Evansella tamaricis]MBU9714784.1 hypothetical protein [Evansella tamaricis]